MIEARRWLTDIYLQKVTSKTGHVWIQGRKERQQRLTSDVRRASSGVRRAPAGIAAPPVRRRRRPRRSRDAHPARHGTTTMTGAAATDVRRRKIIGAKKHRLFHESGEQDVLHQQRHAEYLGIGDLPATPDNRSREYTETQTRELSAECRPLTPQ